MKKVTICLLFFLLSITITSAASYDLIVVRSDIPADYVIASTYANSKKIPVILVNPNEIPGDLQDTLRGYVANGYKNLLIIGGREAISNSVEGVLVNMGFETSRLWDWNRYGTAARVAIELWNKSSEVVLVDGENYNYLLLAHRYSLKNNLPLLFIKNSTIPSETQTAIQRLETKKIYFFGKNLPTKIDGIQVESIDVKSIDFEKEKQEESRLWPLLMVLTVVVVGIPLIFVYKKRKEIPSTILTGEEKKIVEILKAKGSINQNELPRITGFSKPKISRLLQEMESRGIISREKLKKTYAIRLKLEIEW